MILKSCGTSMNAVHERHQIAFTLRCKRNQKKRFFKKSVTSSLKRVINEIVLTF